MGLPRVNQTISNGQLGRVSPPEDGTSLLVVTVAGGAGLKGVYQSREQAEADGINAAYDVSNDALVYEHVKDFYREAPEGTELHLMLLDEAKSMTDILTDTDPAYALVVNYLRDQEGKIKQLAIATNPSVEPATATGANADFVTAAPLAQALYEAEFAAHRPVFIALEGRSFASPYATATDLRALDANHVCGMFARDKARWAELATAGITKAANAAQMGRLLGRIAAIPVQRSIARVLDENLFGILSAELSGGQDIAEITDTELGSLNDKGYIAYRKLMGKNGFYFTDDPTTVDFEDDFAYVNRSRVMDKASRIVYDTLLNELNDEVDVDATTGYLPAIEVKGLENAVEKALRDRMVATGNLSDVEVNIDPEQDVLATDEIEIVISLTPKGTKRKLTAVQRFNNPANN